MVNVLIMATQNDRNEVTAEELFDKLVGKSLKDDGAKNPFEEKVSSINLSDDNAADSDSELDINELLRKYLPEFDEENTLKPAAAAKKPDAPAEDELGTVELDVKPRDGLVSSVGRFSNDPLEDIGELVSEVTNAAVEESKIPEEKLEDIADAAEEKAEDTAESIAAIPFSAGIFTEYVLDNAEAKAAEKAEEVVEKVEETVEEAVEETAEASEEVIEAVEEKTEDFVTETAEKVEEAAGDFEETVEETVETADDFTENAEDFAEEESQKTREFLDKLLHTSDDMAEAETVAGEAADNAEAQTEENELTLSDSLFTAAAESDFEETAETEEDTNEAGEGEEVDPTDLNLMVAFDMDDGDEETAAKAKEVGDKLESMETVNPTKKFVLDRPEYVDKSQTADIRKEFKKKKISLGIRTALCAIFAVVLFVIENITSLTQLFTGHAQQFAGALDPALYPVVYIMVSLQLMLLACLCALPEILDGVKSLFKGAPKPESMTAILAVSGIIYSAVLCNLIKSPNEPVMLNFVVALAALFTLFSAITNNKREMMSFRIVANKKAKHVVRRMPEEESVCEVKAFEGADDVCDVMKIEKTDFVNNFFTRLRTPVQSNCTSMMFLLGITVAIGVLFGVFTTLRQGSDSASSWRAVFSAMYLAAPLSIYFAFSYPFYRANRAAKEYDSAIIGETSLEEYSNASIISFDDKNVFPSYAVKVQNIRIYNNARIDRVLYYASSVFSYAGGPLQDVFEITTKDMGTSENVKIFDTEDGFLATQVDGVNIIFGSYDALVSRGLEIPDKAAEDDVDLSSELSIMYMFRESVLVAKMYIKYDMDEDIDVILKQFAGDGLYVCVRTFDPNIDEKMIANKLGEKRVPLKIIRYSNPDEVGKYEEKVDSGLVTTSSPKSLLQVISYCEKVIHTKKTNVALAILSTIIGAAILLLLMLAGAMNMLSSLLIAVYQLVWLIPTIITSRAFIR